MSWHPEERDFSQEEVEFIDHLLDEFEKEWRAGRSKPRIEDLLGKGGRLRKWLLAELLHIEMHFRARGGQGANADELRRRFPNDLDVVDQFLRAGDQGAVSSTEASSPAFADRFEAVEEIARGGMGAVWRVIDRQFNRPLAVKIMLARHARVTAAVKRFEREAQLTGQLQHPAIPPVADRGRLLDGSPYFSMKLIEGETLRAVLAGRDHLGIERLMAMFEQVCQAVGYAHSAGIVHRDLKPDNVMVGPFGEVQVMDWGMAKKLPEIEAAPPRRMMVTVPETDPVSLETLPIHGEGNTDADRTCDGTVLGTPAYMPPEQARGENDSLDRRADVFSLGAILCEILIGQPPFFGPNALRLAAAADLDEVFERLDQCGADKELIRLCQHCIAASAADRPADASIVAAAIRNWQAALQQRLDQEKSERAAADARVIEERKRVGVERSRRRAVLALVGALTLLCAGVVAVAWWSNQNQLARQAAAKSNSEAAEYDIRNLIQRAEELRGNYEYDVAHSLLVQAQGRTASLLAAEPLTSQITQSKGDIETGRALDELHNFVIEAFNEQQDLSLLATEYDRILSAYGLRITSDDQAQDISRRIQASAISQDLLDGLDQWSDCDLEHRERIRAIVSLADKNSIRREFYAVAEEHIEGFASSIDTASTSPSLIISIGNALARNNQQAADHFMRRGANSHPRDYWLQVICSVDFNRNRQYHEAIAFARAAFTLRPNSPLSHRILGLSLSNAGRLEEAKAILLRGLAQYEDSSLLHDSLAEFYFRIGQYETALSESRRAIQLYSDNRSIPAAVVARRYRELAEWLYLLGREDEVIDCYKRAMKLEPKYATAPSDYGMYLISLRDIDAGEALLKQASALAPDRADILNNLAVVRLKKTDDETERLLRRSIELGAPNSAPYINLSQSLYENGRPTEAVEVLRRCCTKFPSAVPQAMPILKDIGKSAVFEEICRDTLARNPRNLDVHLAWCRYLIECKRFTEVEKPLALALHVFGEELQSPGFGSDHNAHLTKAKLEFLGFRLATAQQLSQALEFYDDLITCLTLRAGDHSPLALGTKVTRTLIERAYGQPTDTLEKCCEYVALANDLPDDDLLKPHILFMLGEIYLSGLDQSRGRELVTRATDLVLNHHSFVGYVRQDNDFSAMFLKADRIYGKAGMTAELHELHERVANKCLQDLGKLNRHTQKYLDLVAKHYESRNEHDRAIPFLEALVFPELDLGILDTRLEVSQEARLIIAYSMVNRLGEANSLQDRVAKLVAEKRGESHKDTWDQRINFVSCQLNSGKTGDAIHYLTENIPKAEACLGKESKVVRAFHRMLGQAFYVAGDLKAAVGELEAVELLSADRLDRIAEYDLIHAYVRLGQTDKADAKIRQLSLTSSLAWYGNSSGYSTELMFLGDARLQMKEYDKAEAMLRRALKPQQANQTAYWPRYYTQSLLGAALAGQDQFEEAESLLLSAVRQFETHEGQLPPLRRNWYFTACDNLLDFYHHNGDVNKWRRWRSFKGDVYARFGDWSGASSAYRDAKQTYKLAAALLLSGNGAACQELLTNEFDRIASLQHPTTEQLGEVVELCSLMDNGSLMDNAMLDRGQILSWARAAAKERDPNATIALGAALLRARQYGDARQWLEESAKQNGGSASAAFLASVVYARIGSLEESQTWYGKGLAACRAAKQSEYLPASLPAKEWLTINVWKAQAESLLSDR